MNIHLALSTPTARNATAKRWPHLFALTFFAFTASAEEVYMPDCALNPPKPSRVVSVPGFPAERLYIHHKYPGACSGAGDSRCKSNAYVITGDELTVSESCNNWSFAEFHGKKTITGWVRSTRLPSDADVRQQVKFAESVPSSTHPACLEAEAFLNEALQKGHEPITGLPSALNNKTTLDTLPAGVGQAGATAGGTEWDVQIQGQPLKAIAYDLERTVRRYLAARAPVPMLVVRAVMHLITERQTPLMRN